MRRPWLKWLRALLIEGRDVRLWAELEPPTMVVPTLAETSGEFIGPLNPHIGSTIER